MENEVEDDWTPSVDYQINSMEGNIQSYGLKVTHRNFLVMGSKEWDSTPDAIKAAAYQTAKEHGWSDEALSDMMLKKYSYLSTFMMDQIVQTLQQLSKKHPATFNAETVPESPETPEIKI